MLGMTGIGTRLFNTRAIAQASDIICITEGEFDAMILEQCGYPAVAVTGANSWKGKRHYPKMFTGFSRIFAFGDGDDAGKKFNKEIFDSMLNVTMVRLPEGKDVNDVYLEGGADAVTALMGD